MTKKRNLIAVLFGMIVALLAFALGFTQKNTMQASADENGLSVTGDVIGASIRYDEDDTSKSGIRFSYVIDKSVSGINADLSNIENAGILSNFTSTLTGDLTVSNAKINTAFYTDGVASTTNKINVGTYDATTREFIKDENGDDLLLQIYFYNIPLNTDKATEITSRGYLQLNDGEFVYSNALSRSIEYVATEAYKAQEYGSDTDFKAFLASCSTFYDVTFETNGGEAVATQSVINSGVIEEATTSLDGYEFIAWTKADGTVVDETTPITENTTVYANFKKTVADNTIVDAAEITEVTLENVSEPTKVTVGDTVLEASNYTLDGTTLIIDKTLLAQGQNVIKVYTSNYVYTEYTKTVIDYTKSLAFTSLDSQHIVGAFYSTAKASATSFVNETVGGREGSFVKVAVGGDLSHLTLKVDSIYDKAVWEKYAGGTLTIDYYTDVAAYNGTTVQLLCTGQKPNNDPICPSSATVVANEWRTVEIAVNDIVANWDYFNGTSITSNSWKSVLMYFSQNVSNAPGNVYFGNFTVSPLDTSIPVAFTSLDASHIVGAQNSAPKASATSFVNETVGGREGSFVKVAVGGDIQSFTLKVGSIYDKSMWEHYAGCTLKIDYYIDIAEYAGTKIQLLSTNRWNAFGAGETSVVVQQWRTIEIEVDDIVANWDYFTAQAITKDYWNGVLLYFPTQFTNTPGNVYFGNFTVSSARAFTSLDASHIVGAQYSTAKASATSFVNETVGDRAGSFVKVEVGENLKYLTLKVSSTQDKAMWENYAGYTLKIDYYTDIEAYGGTTVHLLCTGKNGNNPICASSATVTAKQWNTVEISVDDIVDNWDYFTGQAITKDYWNGVLMYFSKNVGTTPGYVYFGNFTVSKANA